MFSIIFDEADYVSKGGLIITPNIRIDIDPLNEGGNLIYVIHDAANSFRKTFTIALLAFVMNFTGCGRCLHLL